MPGIVFVVGSSNTDLVVGCESLPRPGETVLGGDLATFAGGKGANQAVAAARAGARVRFVGAFGNDDFGAARRADLERDGIDCSRCVTRKGVPSGVALIGIGEGAKAENLIIVAPGANARLTPADVRRGLRGLSSDDVVLCSLEVPLPAVREAVRLAEKSRAVSILNPAPFPAKGLPRALLTSVTALIPNETEFAALVGGSASSSSVKKRILKLIDDGCTHIIMTQGARGVAYYHAFYDNPRTLYKDAPGPRRSSDQVILRRDASGKTQVLGPLGPAKLGLEKIPAPKVKPVDTVGAGDCFNGTLAAWLAKHPYDFDGAIRFAVAAAALKVTRRGAQAGMPKRSEIERMISRL